MSTPFQNRLVGTIIVAAAIIIFLPDILDGDKQSYQADFEAIPDAPAFAKTTADKQFPQDKLASLPKEVLSDEQALDDTPEVNIESVSQSQQGKAANNSDIKIDVLTKTKPLTDKTTTIKNSVNKSSASSSQPKTKQTVKQTTSKVNIKTNTLPEKAVVSHAWVIHLGSFRHQQNVKELLTKLKKNGYVTFTKPIKTKKGTLTKVFVGPELIKSSLEKKLPKLKQLTNVQGKVARFYANK